MKEVEGKQDSNLIDFKFEWLGKDYDKIPPNVKEVAKKLVDLNLVKVKSELDENGNVVIQHIGVCNKRGLVQSVSTGIVNNDLYLYKFFVNPKGSIANICRNRKESQNNYCNLSSCPIVYAGYLWYLKNRSDKNNQILERMKTNFTEEEIYLKNVNELKKMNFDSDIEKIMEPLALPNTKQLKVAFIGEEGTDRDRTISKIADYLYKIGKLSLKTAINFSLTSDIKLEDDKLYVISEIQNYLDSILNTDDFSPSAEVGRKKNKKNINIISKSKSKYIIINCTELEFKKFIQTDPRLTYIFDNVVFFKDYDNDKILEIFEKNLSELQRKKLSEEKKRKILNYIEQNRRYLPFKNEDLALFLAGYVLKTNSLSFPKYREKNITIEEMLSNLVGMSNVKHQLNELKQFLILQKKMEKLNKKVPEFNLHMMFLGNPGTGKTTVARMIAKILFELGYIKENKCVEVEAKDLIAAYAGQTSLKTGKVINKALGGVLFVDEAYSLTNTTGAHGAEAIATLIKAMEDNKGALVVIFAGYSKEMQEFIRANSGIQSRIGYTFEFADYTEDELFEIFKLKSNKIGLTIAKSAELPLRELINFGRNRKNFGNGRFVDNILQKTLTKQASLHLINDDIFVLTEKSIPTIEEIITQASGERNPKDIGKTFEEIIGMNNVKKQIIALGKYIQFRDKLSKSAENSLPDLRLHMLFIGDSGTGKTTMARKVTEMLYNIGSIRINKLVEVERKDLVGEHVGETAPKTEKVIESALGGVLFIDEAYSLVPTNNSNDYGKEAIATLIKAMEDHRDELVVIFAGYKKEMQDFINANSGIASRIGYTFEFENYKMEELYNIFELKCKKYSLKIAEEAKEKVRQIFKYFSSVENFGNGRFVDKVLQEILIKHSMNENLEDNIDTLLLDDIPTIKEIADKTFNNEKNIVLPSDIDDDSRRWTAIHEIGHALIEYLHNGETTLKMITVIPEGNGALGYVLHENPKNKFHMTKRDYLNKIDVNLAGRAAEEVVLGKVSSGCNNDLEKASKLIDLVLNNYGMSITLGLLNTKYVKLGEEMIQDLDKEKKQLLTDCYNETKRMLKENIDVFNKVIDKLMEKGTLSGEEFLQLVKN